MIWGFETDDRDEATAALLVYAVWRSRDRGRFRVTPDVWGQVERFVKSAAKRSVRLGEFLEALKPRLACASIHPAALRVGLTGEVPLARDDETGELIALATDADAREFGARVLAEADHAAVLRLCYRETGFVVALVRDRLERERPIERRLSTVLDQIGAESAAPTPDAQQMEILP